MTEKQRFSNVWDAIGDTPQESLNLKLRSRLMDALIRRIEAEKWNQAEAAKRLGVTQPRVSDLFRGKISEFSLDKIEFPQGGLFHHTSLMQVFGTVVYHLQDFFIHYLAPRLMRHAE